MVLRKDWLKGKPSHWKRSEGKGQVVKPKEKEADFMGLVEAHRAAYGGTKTEAIQAVMQKFPEAHRSYLAKHNPHIPFLQRG